MVRAAAKALAIAAGAQTLFAFIRAVLSGLKAQRLKQSKTRAGFIAKLGAATTRVCARLGDDPVTIM
jgi:hypothetical protein